MTDNQGGVFIDTGTPAMREVGLVTTPKRTDSTINVRDIKLVINLRPVIAKIGGIIKVNVISLADSSRDAICSIDGMGGRITLISSAFTRSLTGSDW